MEGKLLPCLCQFEWLLKLRLKKYEVLSVEGVQAKVMSHTYILYCYLPKGLFKNNDYITLFIINKYNT